MSINGNGDTFTIKGAKLKVSGGVQISGSIAYTDDATGFGGVAAQIDTNNTLNITAGKTSGVAKIERSTTASITAVDHTNVNNNTTIHIALKNTSTSKGDFITLGLFANDDTVKVNYTDEYVISPGETGMITVRKVAGVLSMFVREMFSSTATDFDNANTPFYIKDGVDYKYPLYKTTGTGLVTETIGGVEYYRPSSGIKTKSRPPKGLPDNSNIPTGTLKIGNNGKITTIDYDVFNVSNSEFGAIYRGSTQKVRFALDTTNEEASGSFTDSGVNSGDTYTLYLDKVQSYSSDTAAIVTETGDLLLAFHHDTFANSDDPHGDGDITTAAENGHVYSDTPTVEYTWGTLGSVNNVSVDEYSYNTNNTTPPDAGYTTYTWTPPSAINNARTLVIAGGGGGGSDISGGGGAGGLLASTGTSISATQQTIQVGGGGVRGIDNHSTNKRHRGGNGANSSISGPSITAFGGGGGATEHSDNNSNPAGSGGSGGGGSGGRDSASNGSVNGTGTAGQGYDGGRSGNHWYPGGGGGAGGAGTGGGTNRGHGGTGVEDDILGTSYWWAGGGGGTGHSTTGGNGGQGGGGGGAAPANGSPGTAGTSSITSAENGQSGNANWSTLGGGNAGKHTGGGGGGGHHVNTTPSNDQKARGGAGGSGIVVIKWTGDITVGKKIPKITGIEIESSNVSNISFTTQGTGISSIKYNVNNGSEITVPSATSNVAHGITTIGDTFTVRAYTIDTLGNQLSSRFLKSLEYVYGYETITLLSKSGSQTIVYVDNGTTNVTNTYKSTGGNTWNGGWYMDVGYTAPVTFEYKASASSSDDGNSYKQIGINDTIVQTYGSHDFDIYHYAYYQSELNYNGTDITGGQGSSWNSTDTFYIVYKTNGEVEWWQAGTKFFTVSWGTDKTVYLSTTLHKQGNGSDNGSFRNIRIKRRQWDGTKYIN
jgi:hypothetical protein